MFLFSLFYILKPEKVEYKVLSLLIFAVFFIIGGLRFEVGADWEAYKYFFDDISQFSEIFNQRYEPLYTTIVLILKSIYNNYSFFIFIVFFLAFGLKYKVINFFSPNIFISLIVYLYTVFLIYDINGLRQGLALALTFYSLKYVNEKKLLFFLLLTVLACFFHKSAIIFLPFYWLRGIKINKRNVYLLLFVFLVLAIPLRTLVMNSGWFNAFMMDESLEHYSSYLSDDYQLNIPIISFSVIQRIVILVMFLIFYDRIEAPEEFKLLLCNGYFLGIILFLLLSFSAEMAARLSFYYKTLELIMIPLIVYSPKRIIDRVMILLLFSSFAYIGLYRLLSIPDGYLLPYKNLLLSLI